MGGPRLVALVLVAGALIVALQAGGAGTSAASSRRAVAAAKPRGAHATTIRRFETVQLVRDGAHLPPEHWTYLEVPSLGIRVVVGTFNGSRLTYDAKLAPLLTRAASNLGHAHVLMLNKEDDELFPAPGVRQLYGCVVARSKRLRFRPGAHDEWGEDLIEESVRFVEEHAGAPEAGEQR